MPVIRVFTLDFCALLGLAKSGAGDLHTITDLHICGFFFLSEDTELTTERET